jgi:Family of unknown function (DUF6152)
MKSKLFAVLGASVLVLLVSSTLLGHHAGTLYDRDHPVSLKGTVTQFVFTNPHAQIHFDVKDENGNVSNWIAETTSPAALFRLGWNKNTLKFGDMIEVTGAPFKDGRKVLSIFKLTGGNAPVLTEGADKP